MTGSTIHIEFALISVQKVYLKFSDKQVRLKVIGSSYLGRHNFLGSYWKMWDWKPFKRKDQYLHPSSTPNLF